MSALEMADLKENTTARLASQTDQPAGPSVLPPFSGKLIEDKGLKLSNQNFKHLIEIPFNTIITLQSQVQRNPAFSSLHLPSQFASKANWDNRYRYFPNGKVVTSISQLKATPPFPTPHVLAQFAYRAYEDYKEGETDAQYETRLALPDGWKLLTTASNCSKANDYFGAAYWHSEHQQVVIAHRGTKLTNLGACFTDVVDVLFKHHVPQMSSASTIAHKVVEVLREVSRTKGVSFQLFFTGHSLGGWLAQVTTFTTEYLKREGNLFITSYDNDCYHPHTVVFDSPGCKDMLSEMRDTFDVRLDGRSIDLKHLDITSYLSAPNRINTCNTHLGLVYRIFPDFSDMGLLERKTVLNNIATHYMQEIVEAFDTETGQVRKDEQGKLKVQVVSDWPVSGGLLGGEEYDIFFEWAKHFHDYHPDCKDASFPNLSRYTIRYQTKSCDERVNCFCVFSQEEQEFLLCYLALRQCPKSFKPKEIFSVVKDSQAQEEAENILQSFQIEKDAIICTDPNALQALIPYVKRLLQLFPEIRGIGNKVYQCETNSCIEQMKESPLDFNPDALSVRDFLEDEQQRVLQVRMVDGDEWTGLIKVYQILQKNNYLIGGQYTVLKLERLLSLNKFMGFRTLMQSIKTPYLILIACEDNQLLNEETKDLIRTIFETTLQKSSIKVFLTTGSENRAAHFLQHIGRETFGNGFVTRDEQLNWCDLTSSSQEKLLEKTVKFQGAYICLNQLMSAESPAANLLHLGSLLDEKELKIAVPVPIENVYNELYYIGRTLRRLKVVKQEIFNDKAVRDSNVYLASTDQEFKQHCQLYPNSNVHWLVKDNSGNLVWQKSQGGLETVRRYIDTGISQTYTADDLDTLLEQAQHQTVMLISDTAGMGKSTLLTHLSNQIKQKFPAKWVVRIDLNDHTDALNVLKQEQIDKERAIEFVSEKLLKLKRGLEMELFKQCCEKKQKVRIVIMLDGFDEISPFYKETVIDLLQALRQTAVEQLWVTTRPHLRAELEDRLQQLSYTLEPFSEENQVEFLTQFWSLNDWLTEMKNEEEEIQQTRLGIYAKNLIKKVAASISDKDREFTGIPLQTRMLAEAFDEEVTTFCQSAESVLQLPLKLDLLGLYGRFIERKYDIYQKEKLQVQENSPIAIEQRERDLKCMRQDHQRLALKVLFTEEQVTLLQIYSRCTFSAEELARIGIVQISHDGKLHFIHRTFAEFFVADYLVNRLTEENNTSEQVLAFIMNDIFLKEDNRVIRVFVDGLLSRSWLSKELLKEYGNRISDLLTVSEMVLNQAAREDNVHIIGFLFDSLNAAEHQDTLTKLLLAQDNDRQTAWHLAVLWGNMKVLQKLWDCASENLTRDDLNNKYVSAKDSVKKTAWHVAAEEGNLPILQQLWEWAEECLTCEELNNNLLLAKDSRGKTAWHMAAKSGNTEVLEKIWKYANERLTREDLKNKLLLATDKLRQTAWHYATWDGNIPLLEKLWEIAKKYLTAHDLSNKLMLAKDKRGQTAWHVAAERGNLELLEKLWEWAIDIQTTGHLNSKLMLETDNRERTAWHLAAECGKLTLLEKLREWAQKVLREEEINDNLLLARDDNEQTFLHVVAKRITTTEFEQLCDWAEKNLSQEEIKKLLLAKDDHEHTVMNLVAIRRDTEVLDKIKDWAKQFLTPEEIRTVFGQRR